MEEELPLKLIELSDFLRQPSLLSKRLQLKQIKNENLSSEKLLKNDQGSNGLKFKDTKAGIILLKQKAIFNDNHVSQEETKQKELILPKDVIVFADDMDRKRLGIFQKSNNQFSRHLLITSGAALQALVAPLTNAKEWLIVCKLKYCKRFTKQPSIQGNVVISLNVSHPLVRYEILTALDLLQQSFNEVKSAYIVIDFSHILVRWFKTYLRRTDQYPSLSHRLLYRYQFQTLKCSVTLGKRQYHQENDHYQFGNSLQKILRKSDIPMQIYIDFNSLPTNVYSIELNNIFIYSMNNAYKQITKDMGNGLSLISIQDFNSSQDRENKLNNNNSSALAKKEEVSKEKLSTEQPPLSSTQQQSQHEEEEANSTISLCEPNEQERILFEKLWENRTRIQMQHQQLMMKAARLLCFTSVDINQSFNTKNNQSDLQTIKWN
ncbi:unnamed protein product [Adineta steineri]|uniref:Uncharacterized protein n=1 Tax=Adineta steineri TaxID=433720 RepID=A0A818M7P9_9BILA|nr:unnamed protein product [Adineta steineri]CAF3585910.1 unnamed protein product [Adineta steineri]